MKKKLPLGLWAVCATVGTLGGAAIVESMTFATHGGVPLTSRDVPASMRQHPTQLAQSVSQIIAGGSIGAATHRSSKITSDADARKIALVTERLLTTQNYIREPMSPKISNRIFDRFLTFFDPQHEYFLQSDINVWKPLRDKIGDKIEENGDTSFAQEAFARYKVQVAAQKEFIDEALKTRTFAFTGSDTISLDRKVAPFPKDADAAKELWWQQLRFEYLQERLTDPKGKKKPADIVKTLARRYDRLQKFWLEEDQDQIFEEYLKELCFAFDPHSEYFGKRSTEDFAMAMQLSLAGIGAELRSVDGYTTIESLIPGGPAFKSGKLKVGDKIVGVAQGADQEVIETTDMNIDKVVDMIRGKKGTVVRLSVWPAAAVDPSTRATITLTRDQVKLENKAAKAQIIEAPGQGGKATRIGILSLPSFYGGPGSGRSATEDLSQLIKKLKDEQVAGIILDLRENPGGSLDEAAGVAGLFIRKGPVVQSRYSNGTVEVKNDPNAGPAWEGPLVVMTNRLSASAAEIVTGALHDYGRAVIVGDNNTFGKSTVQDQISLSEVLQRVDFQTSSDPGTIHLTVAKYYLPSGHSVQLTGVPSDIVVPALTSVLDVGERTLNNPLPADEIKPASFDRSNRVEPYIETLKTRSQARISHDPDFMYLAGEIARAKKALAEKTVSLNEAKREAELKGAIARANVRKAILAARRRPSERIYPITVADAAKPGLPAPLKLVVSGQSAAATPVDDAASEDDTATPAANTGPAERDMTLDEARRIMVDYIGLIHK